MNNEDRQRIFDDIVTHCVIKVGGDTLYHYTDLEAAKGIISSQRFRSTAHNCVDDQNELQHAHETIREVVQRLEKHENPAVSDACACFREKYGPGLFISDKRKMFLSCFCSKKNDPYLWEKFGHGGEGICLAIHMLDPSEPPPTDLIRFSLLSQVIYSKDDLRSKLDETFGQVTEQLDGGDGEPDDVFAMAVEALYRIAAVYSTITKHQNYSNEQEIRHVTFFGKREDMVTQERTVKGISKRYIEVPIRAEGRLISFEEIIIGKLLDFEQTRGKILRRLVDSGYNEGTPEYPQISQAQ